MLRSYKTEIKPTIEQRDKINRTIGTCRFIYNFYLAHNREIYEKENKFVSGYNFSIWLNNEYIPNNPEFSWIKEVSGKSLKQSIMNAQRAFKNFFDKIPTCTRHLKQYSISAIYMCIFLESGF